MPLQATSGAASYDAFGGGVPVVPKYIEEYFSTYVYTGTGSTLAINNGIDLATKGGLVWIKNRSIGTSHLLNDTARGAGNTLKTDSTAASVSLASDFVSFNTNGFTVGPPTGSSGFNYLDEVSWSFAKAPKFFDIVTYTGDGSALKTIAHNLGSTPGCMIIKSTSSASWNWVVYHQSLGVTQKLYLNTTGAAIAENGNFGGTAPTSTNFSVGYNATNESGGTYVAYLFAHDAGGFGLTGTDNVISCGSFTTDGSGNATVSLGYEPQWVIEKSLTAGDNWIISDIMREMSNTSDSYLFANLSNAEVPTGYPHLVPTATGFTIANHSSSRTYIYIAIRRGPMKVPTDATKVYGAVARTGTGTTASITGLGFPPDLTINKDRSGAYGGTIFRDRLRGIGYTVLDATSTASQQDDPSPYCLKSFDMSGISYGTDGSFGNANGFPYINYFMGRAPSFFDVVCYTGTGANTTQSHNLGAVPEMIIVKSRSAATEGEIYVAPLGNDTVINLFGASGAAFTTGGIAWNYTTPTASVFSLGTWNKVNGNGVTFVAWIFATCPGVSKVGSYTGNGTTQTINCGFTGGARFVLIKRTDTAGSWYTYDTARGMTVLTDPYLQLNSTAAEVATLGSVTTVSTGFALNSAILAAINVSAGSYIFLAIS